MHYNGRGVSRLGVAPSGGTDLCIVHQCVSYYNYQQYSDSPFLTFLCLLFKKFTSYYVKLGNAFIQSDMLPITAQQSGTKKK